MCLADSWSCIHFLDYILNAIGNTSFETHFLQNCYVLWIKDVRLYVLSQIKTYVFPDSTLKKVMFVLINISFFPTALATSFSRMLGAYHYTMKQNYTNIILSLFSSPFIQKYVAKILKFGL